MTDIEIDERALQMSDDERDTYLIAHRWQNVGVGWVAPTRTEQHLPGGGVIQTTPGGLFSRSSAIREQLARENPGAVPDELGWITTAPSLRTASGDGGDRGRGEMDSGTRTTRHRHLRLGRRAECTDRDADRIAIRNAGASICPGPRKPRKLITI